MVPARLAQEVRVTVEAAVSKRGRKPGSAPTRAPRKSGTLTAEDKVLAAEFTRLVDGFDARLEEIDAAMSLVMKRLKG